MLFAQGKPMTDYKYLRPLYEFLKLKNTPKKHWNDFSSWEILKYLHNQVLVTTKVAIHGAKFVAYVLKLLFWVIKVIIMGN
jgi:hypothetical protein